ncbi:hypothetical protein HMPREF1254_0918 [Prevotella sp. BV3P1]|nr:hypothetical protein HMPREF1254_0918 [Prevotella sp. BV3P1]
MTLNLYAFASLLHVNMKDKSCKQHVKKHAIASFLICYLHFNASKQADRCHIFSISQLVNFEINQQSCKS